jgi:hypothetical protein
MIAQLKCGVFAKVTRQESAEAEKAPISAAHALRLAHEAAQPQLRTRLR